MFADTIHPEDDRWQDMLARTRHDPFQLPGYVDATAGADGGEPIAIHATTRRGEMLLPLVRRRLPGGADDAWDGVSPYGYASPLATTDDPAALHELTTVALERARTDGAVSLFLRLHPFLPSGGDALARAGRVVEHGPTAYFDLDHDDDAAHAAMNASTRRNLRKLERTGYQTTFDEWTRFDDFAAIYDETMRRVGADASYMYSRAFFSRLRERMQDRIHLASVVSPEGETVAATLVLDSDEIVQYHLSGTREDHLPMAPQKLLIDGTRAWARGRGRRIFHLGGGVGAQRDSLYRFKSRLAPGRGTYRTARIVLDEGRYDAAARARGHVGTSARDLEGFFPAYRAPAAT